ncbi:Rab9 effector protein with kelch motif [Carpediemonas membranifera]|uniref:Rab9 effector protein with kelch motif n=1 Tax=Carpediemonas membranifera TaxID=201153 RepID=A0A8J6ARJ7_9EUKA|nr:Rab9 effector protein with kelch motif [Carpediemonas membranifera]|eukprot:KAG9390410.1 Rab9 effector protein with kelch motif [Carpediemonas membranifera]
MAGLGTKLRHIHRILERCSRTNPPALLSATVDVFGPLAFIFGGRDRRRETEIDTMHVFDSRTNTFYVMDHRAPWPSARHRHCSCMIDDNIVIMGGTMGGDSQKLSDTWIFSISSLTWTQGPQGPGARRDPRMASVNGAGYLFGGSGSSLLNDTWMLNKRDTTWRWRKLDCSGAVPTARQAPTFSAVDGEIVLVGGSADRDTAYSFDPETRAWKRLADAPQALDWHGAATVGTKVIFTGSDSHPKNRTYAYDARTNEWEDLCVLPHDMSNQISFAIGTVVFVHGNIKDDYSDRMYFWSDPEFIFRGHSMATGWNRVEAETQVPVVVVSPDCVITATEQIFARNPVSTPSLPLERRNIMGGVDLIRLKAYGQTYVVLLRGGYFILINQYSSEEETEIVVESKGLTDGSTVLRVDSTLLHATGDALTLVRAGAVISDPQCLAHASRGHCVLLSPDAPLPPQSEAFVSQKVDSLTVLAFPHAAGQRVFVNDGVVFRPLSLYRSGLTVITSTGQGDSLFFIISPDGWFVGKSTGVVPVSIDDMPTNLVTLNSGLMVQNALEEMQQQQTQHYRSVEQMLVRLENMVEKNAAGENNHE